MKTLLILALALSAFAADAPKKETPPPVITAEDREALHEAQEALQSDQLQVTLGQAAALRLTDRKKAVDAAAKALTDKCGAYGIVGDVAGRIQCGKLPEKKPEGKK